MSPAFDPAAYLARIALPQAPAADADGLALVQRAQRLAIPFENLDVRLGRGIALDPGTVFHKLVTRRRGGYCFEQNGLFLAALAAFGFAARPLLARVWLDQAEVPARTHMLGLVELDGDLWIADAGFGGSYVPPLPLRDGAEAASPDGARHRLHSDDALGWMLERLGEVGTTDGRGAGAGWMPQYSFDLATAHAADIALANHHASTMPGARHVAHSVVSLVLPRGFASLVDRRYARRSAADAVTAEIASARAYRMRLSLVFGIDLSAEEVAALGLFPT